MKRPRKRVYVVIVTTGVLAFVGWVTVAIWDIVDGQSVIKTHQAIQQRVTFAAKFARSMFTTEGIDMIHNWALVILSPRGK